MAADLERELSELHGCLDNTGHSATARAEQIVGNVGHICLDDIGDKDVDFCCSALFAKEHGVVAFLRKVVQEDEYQLCKADLLAMLLNFTKKYERKLLPYIVDMKDVSMSLFLRDRSAKVKNSALPLLIEVVEQSSGSQLGDELKIEKMVDKLCGELMTTSKHTATVKQNIYHLLGVLAEVYPERMINYSDRLVSIFVQTLKQQMTSKTKKPELSLIAGSLQGLTHLLVHFTQSAEEGSKYAYDIYKYTRLAIATDHSIKRYEMPRAATTLLARHASQFNQYLLDDYKDLYERLSFWCNHRNRESQHAAVGAMDAFFKQISEMLVSRAKEGRKEGAVFKFFVQEFKTIMDNPNAGSKEVAMAIRGYGIFAAPCKIFLSSDDVKFMFNVMIQRSEQVFFSQSDNLEDKAVSLPNFLDALASIIREMDEISDMFLLSLEKLLVILLETFPSLSPKLHFGCHLAVLKVCFSLAPKGAIFKGFLARVVYQGLLRTCSHPVYLAPDSDEDNLLLEARTQKISYKDYVDMWQTLLNATQIKALAALGLSLEERQAFTEAMYDELMAAILHIIEKLDLTSSKEGADDAQPTTSDPSDDPSQDVTSDPIQGLHAVRPKDFIIFINLVDFCRDVLPTTQTKMFTKWCFSMGHQLILYSTKFPLVSGFYKLLAVCMKIASSTQYFKGLGSPALTSMTPTEVKLEVKQESQDQDHDSMELDVQETGHTAGDLTQREACFMLFSKFTTEVLVRLQQYKDDLLSSCLSYILSLPREVVLPALPAIVPALQTALSVGRSYLPLAHQALDAVHSWATSLPRAAIAPYYKDVLGYLDAYLKSGSTPGSASAADNTVVIAPKAKSGKSKRKIPVRLLKEQNKQQSKHSAQSQLAAVRQHCVTLLGSLGGAVNGALLTTTTEEVSRAAVAWDTVQHLRFDMPFMDIKPVIYFDPFLPRVVELAATSSDRQTKVAACELLHSLVLYMLGRSTQQTDGGQGMDKLYERLLPVLMRLACDVEQVSRELFEPLVMQLIHWFTSSKMFGSPGTAILLNTMMDGLVSPTDTALRDFCARGVKEYLHWSIKQTSKQQMEKSPLNVKMLLSNLFKLARHPSAFKRLGAALGFNSIYTVFREEDTLVDVFIFQILSVFVESLAIAHQDDPSLGTQQQTKQAINHVERIITKKATALCKKSDKRKKPKEWQEATLQTCVRWLLRQCGRPQTECRHACMTLVCNLATGIPGVKKPVDLFEALLKDTGGSYYILRFEMGMYKTSLGKQGLARRPRLTDMAEVFTVKAATAWCDLVLATLDCYTWVYGQDLLKPEQLLGAPPKGAKNTQTTVLFNVLAHFFDDLATGDIQQAGKLFTSSQDRAVYTPRERDEYNRTKCTVIVRVMDFIVVMLRKHKNDTIKLVPSSFWSMSLWQTLACCVLQPDKVGFNMANVDVLSQLPQQTNQLLLILTRYLPEDLLRGLYTALGDLVNDTGPCALVPRLPSSLPDADTLTLTDLVRGHLTLVQTRVLDKLVSVRADKLAGVLLDTVFKGIVCRVDRRPTAVTLTPVTSDLGCQLLKLAFTLGLPSVDLLAALLDKSLVRNAASHSTSPHGAIFYAVFKHTINAHLVTTATDSFLSNLMGHVTKDWGIVGNVLTGMLDQIGRDREMRKKLGSSVTSSVLSQWRHLSPWWSGPTATTETKTSALGLLTKVVLIDSKVVTGAKHPNFDTVFDMYLSMLVDRDTSLAFKSRVMDLLAFFCGLPEKETKKLKSKLDRLVTDNFPAISTEHSVGSSKHSDYITALNKILVALELSGSLVLLELLISIVCKEERHVYEDQIQATIARFVKRLPMCSQKPALDVAYRIFSQEGVYRDSQRRAALERVCLSMLRLVHTAALKEFFVDHIKEIMVTIEGKMVKTPESAFASQLTSKLCCYQLVEVMYSRLQKDDVRSSDSAINRQYCSPAVSKEGKEMTITITKAAQAAKFEDMRGESTLVDLRRVYHCTAYNALIAVISCTQTDLKFYTGFLFQEDPNKREFLWENLIDTKKVYEFPVEMERLLERRKKFVAIRSEVREDEDDEDTEAGRGARYLTSQYLADSSLSVDVSQFDFTSSVQATVGYVCGCVCVGVWVCVCGARYLTSQYLADSSLSVDVSQFDFTGSVQATVFSASAGSGSSDDLKEGGSRQRRASRKGSNTTLTDIIDTEVQVRGDYVEMEMDELNQHECMASLTAVLRHMARNNITPAVTKGDIPTALPKWMNNLHQKMTSHTTPLNVRLFLVKLLINTEEVFRPYARLWLGAIVQIITRGDLGTEGINYFMTDLVVTILAWHTVAIPEDTQVDRAMASRLLEVLMSRCHHDNRAVLKNNLEVLKTVAEVWRSRIQVPTKVLYDNFTDRDPKSRRNMTGIQMCGVVLANKLSPYRPDTGVDRDKFFKFLAMNMLNQYKPVYASSAEVTGMALKYLTDTERDDDSLRWRDSFIDNLASMLLGFQESKPDVFITCIHRLQLHYPAIADRFLAKVLFMLPKVHGEFRTHCLEILHSRVDAIDDVFVEMKSKDITGILAFRDEASQHAALLLVKGMLSYLKADQVLYLLPAVTSFTSHPSAHCRSVMYEVLMAVYDSYRDEDTLPAHSLLRTTKESLLHGLSDAHLQNRLSVQNFWSHESRLPVDTLDRLVAMLEAMYSPATENNYLSYASNLLMEMTSKSPDYNRMIFEHPLSECKFEDLRVSAGWRQRHVAMTPLFVETQASQGSGGSPPEGDTVLSTQVRATQDVQQYTATQHDGRPYNWLTQSSLDTFSDTALTLTTDTQSSLLLWRPYNWLTQSSLDTFSDTALTLTTDTQSSLLFTVGTAPRPLPGGATQPRASQQRAAPRTAGPGFGRDRLSADKGDKSKGQVSEILRLKRRFVKDSDARNAYYAKKGARIKQMKQVVLQEQRQRREHQVTMYRKYRIGDLPDIQIQYSYIIAPLQALAQKDSIVARLLFSSIFKAIFAEIEELKTERECIETTKQIRDSLNEMLASSTQFYPPFISCLLDIAYKYPRKDKLGLDPAFVSTASITSMQQPLGIALLEETLIQSDSASEERPSKRARTTESAHISKDVSVWLEVARLYKSVGDYDVLQGIFSSHLGTQKLTSDALQAEMRGDYATAARLYGEGLKRTSWEDPPAEAEVDLWDTSRLDCYRRLTQWEKLDAVTTANIDDSDTPQLDRVWDDTYYQDNYLPHLLRGKLKLLLKQGEGQDDLGPFIDQAVKVPERKALLETKYSEELAILYIWQEEYDRAMYYANRSVDIFLQDWGNLDELMTNSRASQLQNLQKYTEMREFLTFIRKESNFSSYQPANRLLSKWVTRSPDPIADPSDIWDDVITNRCMYLDQISHKLETSGSSVKMEVDGGVGVFDRHKVALRLAQAEAAIQQDNIPVAMIQLKHSRATADSLGAASSLQWSHAYVRTHHRKAQCDTPALEDNLKALLGCIDTLQKQESKTSSAHPLSRHHRLLHGQSVQYITAAVQRDVIDWGDLTDATTQRLAATANCSKATLDEVVNGLIEVGYQQLTEAVSLSETSSTDAAQGTDPPGTDPPGTDPHMVMVHYCDTYLRQCEDDPSSSVSPASIATFPQTVITSLLTAMRHGAPQASQMFPRLLQLVEVYPETVDTFSKQAADVPCWMFLGWVSQITALLDKPESAAVHNILLEMATEYPQALVYPFKMSCDGYQFVKGAVGKKSKIVRDKIAELLAKNKLVDKFIWALEQFGQPNAIFKDWYQDTELQALLMSSQKNPERIKQLFMEMYEQVMDTSHASEDELYSVTQDSQTLLGMGPYRKKFAEQFNRMVLQKFGKDGSKLLRMSPREFSKEAKDIALNMDGATHPKSKLKLCPPLTLKEYSEWLADFQGCDMDAELEIPGQYTGDKKPLPQYHTKISSFGQQVKVMSSIRKPKRIVVYGNDSQEYPFLVKGGEDLRQDQRIEQLFSVMNQVFSADAMCRRRKLLLRTYQVVPMTPRVGLIEWMKNTIPMKEFLYSTYTETEQRFIESQKGPKMEYVKFLKCPQDELGGPKHYLNTYKNINRNAAVTNFKVRESLIPWDLSRRAYQRMSTSPEAFFTLKSNFSTSHGQLSICQYVLGIGDRHLSNFMIDLETGKSVGIDFGHAFGSATQFLPVPELMPFRLTRQIRNLAMPLRERGLMAGTMVHSLRALRRNSDVLANIMDVFIKEPSLDWKQFAGKQIKTMDCTDEDREELSTDLEWYPRQKVAYAREKLDGHNPAYITRDELRLGHGKNFYYSAAARVVLGDKDHDIRARLPERGLTADQQVACLINQATDPNILGRVYFGWEPWV